MDACSSFHVAESHTTTGDRAVEAGLSTHMDACSISNVAEHDATMGKARRET